MSKVLQREIDEILNEEELIAQDVEADLFDDDYIGYRNWLEYKDMQEKKERQRQLEFEDMEDDFSYDDFDSLF